MYINFSNMQIMADNLEATVKVLTETLDRLEYETKRLSQNSEVDVILADMQRTARTLEAKTENMKTLRLSLLKVIEIHSGGEDRIKSSVEGGTVTKQAFLPLREINAAKSVRWEIK